MVENFLYHNELLDFNRSRLLELHNTPILGIATDVHGFTRGPDENVNSQVLLAEAKLLKYGCVIGIVTGYSEKIQLDVTRPMLEYLDLIGMPPERAELYISSRNGALTTHAYTNEVLDAHPILPAKLEAILRHPFISYLRAVTPANNIHENLRNYMDIRSQLNQPIHPWFSQYPEVRLDWHPDTRELYQITMSYDPSCLSNISRYDREFTYLNKILQYTDGIIPETPFEMGRYIQNILYDDGIDVSITAAASHAAIDIGAPNVSKQLGCQMLLPRIAQNWNISIPEALEYSMGGGDSPMWNDRELVHFFKWGVTNIPYWEEGPDGPIVLNYNIRDQVERTLHLFNTLGYRLKDL